MKMSGFDLPTEAQCEIAFRADYPEAYGRYWNGKKAVVITTANLGDVAWYDENSSSMPHAVGAKWPNPWGLYDICNVSTHCRDVYIETYNKSYVDTPCADTSYLWGEGRVIRGCGFGGVKTFCCLSFRRCWTSGSGGYGSGFRLIRNCP